MNQEKNRPNELALPTSCIRSQTATLRAKVEMYRKEIIPGKNQSIIPGKNSWTQNNFSNLT